MEDIDNELCYILCVRHKQKYIKTCVYELCHVAKWCA